MKLKRHSQPLGLLDVMSSSQLIQIKAPSCLSIVLIIFFSLFWGAPSFAQKKIQKPAFKFQHITRELSNNQVFTILQDRSGFFWIGTLGGLHRFKGDDYDLYVTSK